MCATDELRLVCVSMFVDYDLMIILTDDYDLLGDVVDGCDQIYCSKTIFEQESRAPAALKSEN